MEAIIKITEQDGKQAVSARELHEFLNCKKQFADWMKDRIKKYGLVENQDFITFSPNSEKGRPLIEYALSLDCAKELAMVEGNAKGKEARQYFIACEKKLREVAQQQIPCSFADALELAAKQQREIEQQKPKVEYYDKVLQSESLITTNVIAKELGLSAISLNKKLHDLKIIYREGSRWLLYSRYQDKGYMGTKTYQHEGNTHIHTYWTEKGRQFIHGVMNKQFENQNY